MCVDCSVRPLRLWPHAPALSLPLPSPCSQFKADCPGACYRTCSTKQRVCVPRLPPPDSCLGTTPVGYAASTSAAFSTASAEEESQPELPPGSPAPLGDGGVAAAGAGRLCSWDKPCPRGQRCESDYERERYVCVH
jgi:hypothetical protein